MTAPTFPAFIKLEASNTDEAKSRFYKAVDELCSKGESRTAQFSAKMQDELSKALSIRPGAASTFTAEIDRMAVLASAKLDTIAASARRNLDAALSGKVTASGGIDVDVAGAREAANVAERRAAIARKLADATRNAALAEKDFSQATRLSIAATKELADKETQAAAAARTQADATARLQAAMDRAGVSAKGLAGANDNLTRATGAQRQGMLQLGYQIGDAATMFSLGSNAAQIFASQLGQTVQAVQLMTGGTSRLAAFLGGPWGVALSTAAIVAAPFIGKLWETYNAANAATGALDGLIKKQRQQQAEKNTVPNAQKDINALVKRRGELEADIAKRGVRNPATGQLQFVYKQQQELKAINAQILEGRAALDNERAGTLSLDKAMGDLTIKRLKDSYATEKQTKAKVAKVKADRDEVAELNKALAAEIASIQKFAQWNEQALGRGLDRGTAGMFETLADKKAAVAVADALLGAADASEATTVVVRERDLRDELASLRAGLRELQERSRDNSDQMARIKSQALGKIVPAVQPVADALIAEVRAAADTIGRAYASLAAVAGATRHFHHEARQVGDSLARLMATSLIERRDVLNTPDAIAEMLAPLASKGPAASIHVPTYAGVPDDHSATGLMAGMVARQIG